MGLNAESHSAAADEIIPFHYFDDFWHNRALLLDFTYRFDDVLDPGILKRSLERLMQIEGWRKLGGRIRINDKGNLDYHIADRYDDQRPGFLFHQEAHDQGISEHPLASQLPRAKSIPTIHQDPKMYHFFAHPDHPVKMEDWTTTDRPPLSLSIWSFVDATIVTLSFSHTLLDAVGRQCLLKGWTAVINGHEEDVPELVGFQDDPLDSIAGLVPAEKHVLFDRRLTDSKFSAGGISKTISQKATRVTQLPSEYVQKLKAQASNDLQREYGANEPPFLSEGDVLFAYWARLTVSALSLDMDQNLALNNVYNFRGLIDEVVPPDAAFIGNLVSAICTFMTVKQLLDQPLGVTALQLRNDLLRQRSSEQVKALVTLHKETFKTLGRPPMFGDWSQMFLSWSNWHRARFYDFDFSGAVTKQGTPDDQRKNGVGQPSLISLTGHENGLQVINGGSLMGRDASGNWWIHWSMREDAWPFVEQAIEDLSSNGR